VLAERFGAKWIFGGGIFIAGILTLLTPFAARLHVGFLIAIRLLIGAFEVCQSNKIEFEKFSLIRHLLFQVQRHYGAVGFHH
jgi:hypothetical protein